MTGRLKDIVPKADHQPLQKEDEDQCLITTRGSRSPLEIFQRRKKSSWNLGLQISTILGDMRKLLEVLHQGRTLLTPQWDQFGGITLRLERQRLNQRTNMREQMTTWKLYLCLKVSLHTEINWGRTRAISTLRRSMRQLRPPSRFRDFIMD